MTGETAVLVDINDNVAAVTVQTEGCGRDLCRVVVTMTGWVGRRDVGLGVGEVIGPMTTGTL